MAIKNVDKWLRGFLLAHFESHPKESVSIGQIIDMIDALELPEIKQIHDLDKYDLVKKHLHKLVREKFLWPAVRKSRGKGMYVNLYEIRQRNAVPIQ